MPLPAIAGTVRAAVIGAMGNGQTWVNVHHFRYAAGASSPGSTEIDGLDVELYRFYVGTAYGSGTPYLTKVASPASISRIDYTPLIADAGIYSKSHASTATGGTSTLPAEVAAVLTLRTAKRGRRHRGRIYLPAPQTGSTDAAGLWLAAFTTGIIAQYQGMLAALAAKQWVPVVASYGRSLVRDPNDKYDKIEVTWVPYATDITSVTMDVKPDVMRGRK